MKTVIEFYSEYFPDTRTKFTQTELLLFAEKYAAASGLRKLSTAVALAFRISEADMFSHSRKREYVEARQMYTSLLFNNLQATLVTIGKDVGIDHATVLHSIKLVDNLRDTQREFNHKYLKLQALIDEDKVELPPIGAKKITST